MPLDDELGEVRTPQPEKVMCIYEECPEHGGIMRCYIHTYVLCPIFDKWYDSLDDDRLRNNPLR